LITPDQQSTEEIHRLTDSNLVQLKTPTEDALVELLKQATQQLLARAIEAEVDDLLTEYEAQSIEG